MPKISVITICYNEPNVEKTCESIVNQTWQDFEWIVIDGGSNKETLDIFEKYKHRIDKFVSEQDSGVYNAMNKGIALAQGEYLNFLNAGDYYNDSEVLMNIINSNLDSDIIYSDLKCINPDNTEYTWTPPSIVDDKFLIETTLPHPSSFINRKLFELYGGYNESYKIVSDWEKWIVFISVNKCSYKYVNILCSDFNMNGISSTNPELCQKEREEVINKYYTQKQLKKILATPKIKYSILEQIFSIKNDINKKHKIITFMGIHFKIKRK